MVIRFTASEAEDEIALVGITTPHFYKFSKNRFKILIEDILLLPS
tara:strand:- start:691 stop:825 length:135 start_codon:yes stop_codon:yes gene_type:complete